MIALSRALKAEMVANLAAFRGVLPPTSSKKSKGQTKLLADLPPFVGGGGEGVSRSRAGVPDPITGSYVDFSVWGHRYEQVSHAKILKFVVSGSKAGVLTEVDGRACIDWASDCRSPYYLGFRASDGVDMLLTNRKPAEKVASEYEKWFREWPAVLRRPSKYYGGRISLSNPDLRLGAGKQAAWSAVGNSFWRSAARDRSLIFEGGTALVVMAVRCRKCPSCLQHRRDEVNRLHWREFMLCSPGCSFIFDTLTFNSRSRRALRERAVLLYSRFSSDWGAAGPTRQREFLVKACWEQVTKYVDRLRRSFGEGLRYSMVLERHKDGFPHFHILWAVPAGRLLPVDLLKEQWVDIPRGVRRKSVDKGGCRRPLEPFARGVRRLGFTETTVVEGVDKAINYVLKYITKDFSQWRHSLGFGSTPVQIAAIRAARAEKTALLKSQADGRAEYLQIPVGFRMCHYSWGRPIESNSFNQTILEEVRRVEGPARDLLHRWLGYTVLP